MTGPELDAGAVVGTTMTAVLQESYGDPSA